MNSSDLISLKSEYLQIFENMEEEVHVHDLMCNEENEIVDLILKYINPASTINTEISKESIIGKKASEIYESKDVLESNLKMANEVISSGKNEKFEIYFPDIGRFYFFNAFEVDGSFITIGRDITSQKKLENWIEIQSNTINNVNDAVIILDEEKRIIYWNKGAENLFGFRSDEILTEVYRSMLNYRWLTLKDRKNAYWLLKTIGEWEGKNLSTKKDGKEVYIHSLIKTFKDEKGQRKTLLILNDITGQTNIEQALEANYNRLQEAQRIGKIGNWEWDIKSNVLTISDGLYRIYGIDPGEYVKYETILDMVVPEDQQIINDALEKALREHRSFKYEFTIRRKDGNFRDISCNGEVITDFAGHPLKIVCVEQDITERKEIEYELWKAKNELESTVKRRTKELNHTNVLLQDELEERKIAQEKLSESEKDLHNMIEELKRSNDELKQFAYITSHDLQEPLRTISSFTQLLERRYKDQMDSNADEFIEFIVNATKRMQDLIKDLLEYSRVTTRGNEFIPVNTEDILQKTISNLHAAISESEAEITYDELPEVMADHGQMGQLFQNLISNALKFKNPHIPPKIHISARKDAENNEYIFNVQDNGIGIEKEYFDRIFTIFQRLHTREEYSGTGIGLSIAKKIVERHGG
ncbi:MAG: PAS domain S-box protein, partial [Methanobacterium sp.]